jgi:hypothetical protein
LFFIHNVANSRPVPTFPLFYPQAFSKYSKPSLRISLQKQLSKRIWRKPAASSLFFRTACASRRAVPSRYAVLGHTSAVKPREKQYVRSVSAKLSL